MIYLNCACMCSIGNVRSNNEDNFLFAGQYMDRANRGLKKTALYNSVLAKPVCFAVFDGMGGEDNGEDASYTAAAALDGYLSAHSDDASGGELLRGACAAMNENVCARRIQLKVKSMGSTAAILYLIPEGDGCRACICNLGDSRVYMMRGGVLRQLSVDHAESREQAEAKGALGHKPRLTAYLGVLEKDAGVRPYVAEIAAEPGDQFLICSDGVTDMLTGQELVSVMTREQSAGECAQALVSAALANGGRDNATCVICRLADSQKAGGLLGLLGIGHK